MDPAGYFICRTRNTSESVWKTTSEIIEPIQINLKDNKVKDESGKGGLHVPALDAPRLYKLAVDVPSKWSSPAGLRLTVAFIHDKNDKNSRPFEPDVRTRILWHMNSWSEFCDVLFIEEEDPEKAQVRVSRSESGYWSKIGTEILKYKKATDVTMNLGGFGPDTKESEYRSIVRHETGHTLGFVHESLRKEIIQYIDKEKAEKRYKETQPDWSPGDIYDNVLNPLDPKETFVTPSTDVHSIMCYPLHPMIMKKGAPYIPGGVDFSELDEQHAGSIYPYRGMRPISPWILLDNNLATWDIIATNGHLYQRRNDNSTWSYREAQEDWEMIDNDKGTVQLAADGDKLYKRTRTGLVFMYKGTPITGWERISDSILTTDIVASAGKLYRCDSETELLRYSGQLNFWNYISGFPIKNDKIQMGVTSGKLYGKGTRDVAEYDEQTNASRSIVWGRPAAELIASERRLYLRTSVGEIYLFHEMSPDRWKLLYNEARTDASNAWRVDVYAVQIVADGDDLYLRHNDGRVFIWTAGSNVNDNATKIAKGTWKQVDGNATTRKIAVAGGNLYKLHNNGSISKYRNK